jgi:hypothetical protein
LTSSVDFEYKNGIEGCAFIVPWVKNEDSFRRQAKTLNWIESILEHLSEKNNLLNGCLATLGKK